MKIPIFKKTKTIPIFKKNKFVLKIKLGKKSPKFHWEWGRISAGICLKFGQAEPSSTFILC